VITHLVVSGHSIKYFGSRNEALVSIIKDYVDTVKDHAADIDDMDDEEFIPEYQEAVEAFVAAVKTADLEIAWGCLQDMFRDAEETLIVALAEKKSGDSTDIEGCCNSW